MHTYIGIHDQLDFVVIGNEYYLNEWIGFYIDVY
ncbi:hypothetical protein M2347_000849 [Chryseobacterium sp. H1D6B]|nr:hypothetical protein [Chryseobacterium sp. H1D6B]